MYKDEVKKLLNDNSISPEQKFGQNFLCDEEIINKIIDISGVNESSNVLEIGPGIGALTRILSDKASKLTVVEIDKRLVDFLNNYSQISDNVRIISSDFLKLNPGDYIENAGFSNVLSNIPYYVMTPIIKKLIIDNSKSTNMTFMIEDQAFDRIGALPNTKSYGPLAVLCNNYGIIKKEFKVPAKCFIPEPHTLSCVISLRNSYKNVDILNDFYLNFLEACFANRRKTLYNNLSSFIKGCTFEKGENQPSINDLGAIIEKVCQNRSIRAESLTADQFISLYKYLYLD